MAVGGPRPGLGALGGRGDRLGARRRCSSGTSSCSSNGSGRAQADLAERTRAEERNRIARELHDVIAHSLTVSLLHVTSARLAVEHDPADAARALAEAERLGTREPDRGPRHHGTATAEDGASWCRPARSRLGQVPELVGQLRRAGADVTLAVDGDLATLPGDRRLDRLPHRAGGPDQRHQTRPRLRPSPWASPATGSTVLRGQRRAGRGRARAWA